MVVPVCVLLAGTGLTFADDSDRGSRGAQARETAAQRGQAARDRAQENRSQDEAAADESQTRGAQAREDASTRAEQGRARGDEGRARAQGQRAQAMQRQAETFERVHNQRMARINRIRELARAKDNPEMLERVNSLETREKQRHARQIQQLQRRGEDTPGSQAQRPADDSE